MHFAVIIMIILLMIVLNAIFAAYEMALASITRTKLLFLVQTKKRGATEALFMKDRMEASLAVVQLGITLVGAIAAATGGSGITDLLNPYFQRHFAFSLHVAEFLSLIILIIPLSALTIIFAELIPKTYALKHSDLVVLKLSMMMKYFSLIAYPIVFTMENIVKTVMRFVGKRTPANSSSYDRQSSLHELTAALSVARTSRLIDAQQEKIVLSAAQLSIRPIKDIMIPAADISVIPLQSTLSEALLRAHLDMHTRFPVCEIITDMQTVQGYINFKDIIATLKINPEDPTIKGIIRPLHKFADSTTISKVLERMILEKLHIGLIENDKNIIIGMITQEDIIEELVGDIEDEFDRLPHHMHPYGHQWFVGGAVPMSAIAKMIGIEWLEPDLKLADWCQRQHIEKPFSGGETIEGNGFQVMIRKLRRKKISEAFITKSP